ncbi:hypothetical protein HMPREF1531_00051 [Propionibacterium sp. oral taxon 192 str. F0372]|uniref:DsbA family protein n=1 Tax=Propionibacterium sp. oral taxon 192 TaxID=671222 RepID=UPI0003532F23|nr:thioredoxin domain-containing protein [Propionibacterium sp. oral taxon 192]EPH07006.1 hypothetical protein HMPREF1531_00051 [Propionibacterium sp. oral taxon 192 str. F0372]
MSKKDNNQAAPVGTSKRAQLAAQQAAEAAHKRMMRIVTVIGIVLALVIVSIVTVVLVQNHEKDPGTTETTAEQIVPVRANADGNGIVYHESTKNTDAPLVDAYLDYQCPGCAAASRIIDPMLEELADNGSIQLVYHTLHGLDARLKNDSSYRSAIAATCVANLDTDYFPTYSSTIFANQPRREGIGYTNEQLTKTFTESAGITGADLETFQACYTGQATKDFIDTTQKTLPDMVTLTPSFVTNNKVLDLNEQNLASKEALLEAIKQAAGQD